MKNHYQTLGIPNTASQDDIKTAFRKLAHIHHPDKGGSAEKFKEINTAYTDINTPDKQRSYNARMGIGVYRPAFTQPVRPSGANGVVYTYTNGTGWQTNPQQDMSEAFRRNAEEQRKKMEDIQNIFKGNYRGFFDNGF